MKRIRHLFFDVDDTIFDFDKCAAAVIKQAFEEYGLKYDDNVFPAFKRINTEFWRRIEKGEIDRAYLSAHRFDAVFRCLGIKFDGTVFEERFRAGLHTSHEEVEGAARAIKALAGKYKMYVASNSFYAQQLNRLTLAGLNDCFDAIFVSEEVGYSKPSREFFDEIMKRASVGDPERAMMIGDSLTADIKGAAAAGMRSCWFNRTGAKAPPYVDVTTDDISRLPEILARINGDIE